MHTRRAPREPLAERSRELVRVAYIAFFVSGLAALLDQVVWQRILAFFGGADVFSITIIVAVFMGGLGFGSVAGGHLADRLERRERLLAFALAELAVAAFALASPAILYDLLYVRLGTLAATRATAAVVLFAVLLWPTFFMGMSLPLLARALADGPEASRRVAALYGWNTLGAACGAVATAWLVLRALDFRSGLRLGAALSVACALLGVALALAASRRPEPSAERGGAGAPGASPAAPGPGAAARRATAPAGFPLAPWLLLYGLAGFVALSLEILWFRVLGVFIKSNAFTFGSLLAIYLAGVGLGALAGARAAPRSRDPARAFLWMQAAIPVVAALSLTILARALPTAPRRLRQHVAGYEPVDVGGAVKSLLARLTGDGESVAASADAGTAGLAFVLYAVVPFLVMGPATILMGTSFGYLQAAVQTDLRVLGRRVGWVQAANIVGAMLGAVVTGLVALHWLGAPGTLRLLCALAAPFLGAAWWLARRRGDAGSATRRHAGALAGTLAALLLVPQSQELWARLHGAPAARVVAAEDRSGLSVLVEHEREVVVYAGGLGQSSLPFGGFDGIHTALGALPAMVHPDPRAVAVIGLGSGDTLFGIAGRPETEVIDSIEIVAPALETLRALDARRPDPGLRALLRDPRIRHHFTDGRAFLAASSRRYDIIEADALRPSSAYAGNLYSREYFELLRDRLLPGGLAVSWAATDRVRDTFVRVFPHVVLAPGILIGSSSPIAFDEGEIRRRLRHPFTRRHYESAGIDIERLMERYLASPVRLDPGFERTALGDENRDLFPRDEFMVSRSRR